MRRSVIFIEKDKKSIRRDISGMYKIVSDVFKGGMLLSEADKMVFQVGANGYLIAGIECPDDFTWLQQLVSAYDNVHVVVDNGMADEFSKVVEYCKKLIHFIGKRKGFEVSIADNKVYADACEDVKWCKDNYVKLLVRPKECDEGGYSDEETSSGNYPLGNIIWSIYAGRYSQLEDLCYSDRLCNVFTAEVLSRCFGVKEIDAKI